MSKNHTEEWKKMMCEKNTGKNNPNYGNHALKGIPKTEPKAMVVLAYAMYSRVI